jgi:hypothetical protein
MTLFRIEIRDPAYPAVWFGAGTLVSEAMRGLPAPRVRHHGRGRRLRWFFTPLGWKRWGRSVISQARAQRFEVRVLRIHPRQISPVYRDRWQVAGYF